VAPPDEPERVFTRNPRIEEAPLQGELMLFDPDAAKFYVLNRTMAFVWSSCDGSHTLPGMLAGLQGEFDDVPPSEAEADLRKALSELLALGLVVDSPRAAPVP
jgi:hypothetical protein